MPETKSQNSAKDDAPQPKSQAATKTDLPEQREKEIGGRGGLDPTRYGDWEKAGRCIDF